MAKIEKHFQNNFTITSNHVVRDDRLSWKARGIFVYLWSQNNGWDFYETEVSKHAPDGLASLKAGLKELEGKGYLKRERIRDDKGHLTKSKWILTDSPTCDFPTLDKPTLGEPTLGNRTLRSTNLKNNQLKEVLTESNTSSKPSDLTDVKSSKPRKRVYSPSDTPYQLASYLFKKILENNPTAKKPNVQDWSNTMRLIVERDKFTPVQVKQVIDWCQNDSFWMHNILSPKSLRHHFDRFMGILIKEQEKVAATVVEPLPPEIAKALNYDYTKDL